MLQGIRARFILIVFLLVVLMVALFATGAPTPAFAQLSSPGKLLTYHTIDTDSGEELQRAKNWETTDGHAAVAFAEAIYPAGTRVLSECVFANGFARPATRFRSIMRGPNGELERSDFDTFDPTYYPF